ncbi:universal stress protein [Ferviditalea candida]|uniref:Universal stress protein n=1 Tax=Ferviditalea candida TaxID=3108399 RepID=A0ABU5ZNA4_9BACL|nr:universal stress protein [Paenibacillaceae bacterium T2]
MFGFYSRILVAYDGSELSDKALDLALKLAEQDSRIEVHAVTVWDDRYVQTFGYYDIVSVEELAESRQRSTEELFGKIKGKLDAVPNKTATIALEGNPAKMLAEYAKDNDCDLIVMGSRGLSSMKELFLGSVSHNVVQQAHCPVLIAK